jgi:hypothetical protein
MLAQQRAGRAPQILQSQLFELLVFSPVFGEWRPAPVLHISLLGLSDPLKFSTCLRLVAGGFHCLRQLQ